MASETFVVAYENKEGDDGLLDYAIARAKKDAPHSAWLSGV